jgi:hypothetical protein
MGRRLFFALALIAAAVVTLGAFQLRPPTLKAFERYVQLTEARMATETSGASPFLWIDQQPEPKKSKLLAQLKAGEIVSERLETRDGRAEIDIPDGLAHHWVGTVFMPQAKRDRVIAFVQDYGRYPQVFAPLIQRSTILSQTPDRYVVQMRTWSKKLTVTVVIDADYTIEYRELGPAAMFTKSTISNVYEVAHPGSSHERRTPADQSTGYLWRLNTYCSFAERPEGTYEQCESISLTRDIPFGLGWIVRPFITGIPRETLDFTLSKVRAGVK